VIEAGGSKGRVCLASLLKRLGEREIVSVMLEGGEAIFTSAIEARLVDRFLIFVAPLLIGGRSAPGLLGGDGIDDLSRATRLRVRRVEHLDQDLLVEADPDRCDAAG
jgi:diaminohydroxyphosphoribosylaminopyrimidine deaminase/5-amino-6-(5-phosphoribosylamino)uracil reductase